MKEPRIKEPRILVACIGNVFLGDDGFGVEVARLLSELAWPAGVTVRDFGIRGFDLACAIASGYDLTILVDAAPRGCAAGTLYLIEPDLEEISEAGAPEVEMHTLDPMKILALARALGASLERILIIACEPESFGAEGEGRMGLSEPVARAAREAVPMIESLVDKMIKKMEEEIPASPLAPEAA